MTEGYHRRQGVRDLPDILYQLGVTRVVLCPGSRNAPLILAFAKYGKQECFSIVDERSAAYYALGMAQHSRQAVAVVCTSGTAALNFAPALAEAYYQNVPLLAITADRPAEWIDQADGQTIRQPGLFSNFVKASFQIPGETCTEDELWMANRQVSQSVALCKAFPRGPVHLNISLQEPLYTSLPDECSGKHVIRYKSPDSILGEEDAKYIHNQWDKYTKKWLVLGALEPDTAVSTVLEEVCKRNDLLLIAENTSNFSHAKVIDTPETWIASLTEDALAFFKPELLITIGHSVVSKRLKQYLRKYSPKEHWHVGVGEGTPDTFQSLSRVFQVKAHDFLSVLRVTGLTDSAIVSKAMHVKTILAEKHNTFITSAPFCDLTAISEIIKTIPEGSVVHWANSMPIRYGQMFTTRKGIECYGNRGTSGIDGCTSTAAGSAIVSGKLTVLITGDLAFLYDSNALWNRHFPENLKIIVINNNGGNIFRLIDSSGEMDTVRPFMDTPHNIDISFLSKAYGIYYQNVTNKELLNGVLLNFFLNDNKSILEITTNRDLNATVYRDYFNTFKDVKIFY